MQGGGDGAGVWRGEQVNLVCAFRKGSGALSSTPNWEGGTWGMPVKGVRGWCEHCSVCARGYANRHSTAHPLHTSAKCWAGISLQTRL